MWHGSLHKEWRSIQKTAKLKCFYTRLNKQRKLNKKRKVIKYLMSWRQVKIIYQDLFVQNSLNSSSQLVIRMLHAFWYRVYCPSVRNFISWFKIFKKRKVRVFLHLLFQVSLTQNSQYASVAYVGIHVLNSLNSIR